MVTFRRSKNRRAVQPSGTSVRSPASHDLVEFFDGVQPALVYVAFGADLTAFVFGRTAVPKVSGIVPQGTVKHNTAAHFCMLSVQASRRMFSGLFAASEL